MPDRRGERTVVSVFTGKIVGAKAHGDHGDARLVGRVTGSRVQVAEVVGIGLDQQDIRPGGDCVGPFDVQGDLSRPAGVGGGQGDSTVLVDHAEEGRAGAVAGSAANVERFVECLEIANDIGIAVGVDNIPRAA